MQIVIDIDEALYEYMQVRYKYRNKGDEGLSTTEEAGIAIKDGTPLPKGHGRLIDADAVLEEPIGDTYKDIEIAETIVEAESGGEE